MNQEELEQYIGQSQLQTQQSQNAMMNAQQQVLLAEEQRGLAETQLEVDSIISKIYHLIRQDTYIEKPDGTFEWRPLSNQQERTLTNWGVDRTMQAVHFYVNKNNLLSNYDDITIKRLMKDFLIGLNNLMLLKYEFLFNEPDFEECKRILKERVENKKKLRVFAMELVGKPFDEQAIEDELLLELETKIEKEFEKVKTEKRKEKLREYETMIKQLDAMVLATYNRAYRGEERGSIRRHTNISEIIGKPMTVDRKQGGLFGWVKA